MAPFAPATAVVQIRIVLNSMGNMIQQELRRVRGLSKYELLNEIEDNIGNLEQYGGTVDVECEDVDFNRAQGRVSYTSGVTATAYTVTVGGTATGSVTGTAGNGAATAVSVAAAINAHATLGRWVEAVAFNDGAGAGHIQLTLRAFLGNSADLGQQISLAATGVGASVSGATFGTGGGSVAGTNSPSSAVLGQL